MAAAHRLVFENNHHNNNNNQEDQQDVVNDTRPYSLLVLEGSEYIGGRTRNYDVSKCCYDTIDDSSGGIVEMGGTWISSDHTAVIDLCRNQLQLQLYKASFITDSVNNNDADKKKKKGQVDPGI